MVTFDNINPWNSKLGKLENTHPEGSLESLLVDTIIACAEEAQKEGVPLEKLFGKSRVSRTAMHRGYLMVAIYLAWRNRISCNISLPNLITGAFGKNHSLIYNFLKYHESGLDVLYEAIRKSPFAARVDVHLKASLKKLDQRGGFRVVEISLHQALAITHDCPNCREKFLAFVAPRTRVP